MSDAKSDFLTLATLDGVGFVQRLKLGNFNE
jgi:hypothetical protein